MKIKIDIDTRGTLKEFKKSYQRKFLEKYGYKAYGHVGTFGSFAILAESVKTKYGELVVHDNDVVTYVGNKHWSVSHEAMVGKSPDNQKQFAVFKH